MIDETKKEMRMKKALRASETLAHLLKDEGFCFSIEEATAIAEATILDGNDDDINHTLMHVDKLAENIGIADEEAKVIVERFKSMICLHPNDDESDDDVIFDDSNNEGKNFNDERIDPDEDVYLREGECELCDRYIKLTKHHLVPKETWSRVQTKLMHAAEAKQNGDIEKALIILGAGLADKLESLSTNKESIKDILHSTCDICRQCHNTVHRVHTNLDLALNYNTVEKLLDDDMISKFCRWASKQRTGQYSR
jgi:hypothetical protein